MKLLIENKLVGLFALVLIVGGCSESSVVGEDFMGNDSFEISFTDTVALQVNTLRYDSLPTSTSDRLLLAHLSDTLFSSIKAEAYFLMSTPTSSDIGDDEVFDSLSFYLPQDGYSEGFEESQNIIVKLERLHSELEYPESGVFYNFSNPVPVTAGTTTLYEGSAKFYIDRQRNVSFRLGDDFGQELFQAIRDDADILESTSEFHQYLKGFRLSIDAGTEAAAIGFIADSLRMRIHTTNYEAVPPQNKTIDFYVSGSPYFTRYEYEVPEQLNAIETFEDEVSSAGTNGAGLLYGGLGYVVEVAIPSAANLKLDDERNYVITGAELKLYPVEQDADWPEELSVSYMDNSHVILSDAGTFSAHLVLDEDHGRDTYYSVDIGNLIEYLLDKQSTEIYSLLIGLSTVPGTNSLTSLWLGGESFKSELILYTISNK